MLSIHPIQWLSADKQGARGWMIRRFAVQMTTSAPIPRSAYQDRLIRLPEVLHLCGLSRSTIYTYIAAEPPLFPKPVKLGQHAIAWSLAAVEKWIADRLASVSVEQTS